jgi:hypothetical protein
MTTTPTKDRLEAFHMFFKELADKQHNYLKRPYGTVELMYKEMVEDEKIPFERTNYISNIMTELQAKGLVERLRKGSRNFPSLWDVSKFIEQGPEGYYKLNPQAEFAASNETVEEQPKFEVELVKDEVREPEERAEYVVTKQDNRAVIEEINTNILGMISYLRDLPSEMTSQLNTLSNKLELADHNVILELTKEKEDLKEEVSQLKEELERASATPDYSEHYIYRQRNLILDEVQRMLHAPAWSVRQNKDHYTNSIIEKLDNIMSHLGIKAESE